MEKIISWIKSKIGCGYVYGATGWTCSQKRLDQQAAQYPEYADTILSTCKKWIGVQCFDCAQLIRRALESIGMSAPSGATSQWKADIWTERGEIANMPDVFCALYRQKESKMQHTGWHIGGGVVIDARGSSSGVIMSDISKYPWTHYAIPKMPDSAGKEETNMTEETICFAVVTTEKSDLNFRKQPTTSAGRLTECNTIPRGASVEVLSYVNEDWARVRFFGYTGYVSRKYLVEMPVNTTQPDDDADDVENETGCEKVEGVRVIHRIKKADGTTVDIDGDFTVSVVFLDDAGNEL